VEGDRQAPPVGRAPRRPPGPHLAGRLGSPPDLGGASLHAVPSPFPLTSVAVPSVHWQLSRACRIPRPRSESGPWGRGRRWAFTRRQEGGQQGGLALPPLGWACQVQERPDRPRAAGWRGRAGAGAAAGPGAGRRRARAALPFRAAAVRSRRCVVARVGMHRLLDSIHAGAATLFRARCGSTVHAHATRTASRHHAGGRAGTKTFGGAPARGRVRATGPPASARGRPRRVAGHRGVHRAEGEGARGAGQPEGAMSAWKV
jgi:hypothetical protein